MALRGTPNIHVKQQVILKAAKLSRAFHVFLFNGKHSGQRTVLLYDPGEDNKLR